MDLTGGKSEQEQTCANASEAWAGTCLTDRAQRGQTQWVDHENIRTNPQASSHSKMALCNVSALADPEAQATTNSAEKKYMLGVSLPMKHRCTVMCPSSSGQHTHTHAHRSAHYDTLSICIKCNQNSSQRYMLGTIIQNLPHVLYAFLTQGRKALVCVLGIIQGSLLQSPNGCCLTVARFTNA